MSMSGNANDTGALQVSQIPWDKEARYRLPVHVWQQMMDLYYPNTAWLCLRKDVFDRLYHYKVRRGIPTFWLSIVQEGDCPRRRSGIRGKPV